MKIKVIIIDAEKQELREGFVDGLKDMQDLVGGLIAVAGPVGPHGDDIYVDDEGLLKSPKNFFMLDNGYPPSAGNGFIMGGTNEEGIETDVAIDIEEARNLIKFMSIHDLRNQPELFRDEFEMVGLPFPESVS